MNLGTVDESGVLDVEERQRRCACGDDPYHDAGDDGVGLAENLSVNAGVAHADIAVEADEDEGCRGKH